MPHFPKWILKLPSAQRKFINNFMMSNDDSPFVTGAWIGDCSLYRFRGLIGKYDQLRRVVDKLGFIPED